MPTTAHEVPTIPFTNFCSACHRESGRVNNTTEGDRGNIYVINFDLEREKRSGEITSQAVKNRPLFFPSGGITAQFLKRAAMGTNTNADHGKKPQHKRRNIVIKRFRVRITADKPPGRLTSKQKRICFVPSDAQRGIPHAQIMPAKSRNPGRYQSLLM